MLSRTNRRDRRGALPQRVPVPMLVLSAFIVLGVILGYVFALRSLQSADGELKQYFDAFLSGGVNRPFSVRALGETLFRAPPRSVQGEATRALNALSAAFGELAAGVANLPDEQAVLLTMRARLCDACPNYARCWAGEDASAVRLFCQALRAAFARQLIDARYLFVRHAVSSWRPPGRCFLSSHCAQKGRAAQPE